MLTSDTIAAPATGWAHSPRAVIRLSGPGVPDLLARLLRPGPPPPGGVGPAAFLLGDAVSLPCMVLCYGSGRSYTGQHAAEIAAPGNPALVERIVARLVQSGARPAGPGEFTARAFLSGRLSLAQAEGVAAAIAAATESQLAAAESLMSGRTGQVYQGWADELSTLLALVEAGIDFSDQEDVVPIAPVRLRDRLSRLVEQIRSRLGAAVGREHESAAPIVAIAGAPNAGKSTLFNALLRRRRSVESPVAGTTRDVIAEPLDLSSEVPGAPTVSLIDLAGLDTSASGIIDAQAQAHARQALSRADVIIHCDPSGRFAEALGVDPSCPIIRVRTKADLPHPSFLEPHPSVSICALDGWNLSVLRRAIADAASARVGTDDSAVSLLPRHRLALAQTLERLEPALAAARAAADGRFLPRPELIAGDLRAALDRLGELTGQVAPDDIIGRIFATFCVGK